MFFSIITSVLTASEELRVNFPAGKYLGASDTSTADSSEGMREDGQDRNEDPDARINVEDIESGRVDMAGETINDDKSSEATISSLQDSKNIDEEKLMENAEGNQESGGYNG